MYLDIQVLANIYFAESSFHIAQFKSLARLVVIVVENRL